MSDVDKLVAQLRALARPGVVTRTLPREIKQKPCPPPSAGR
jgi:hypothetical protein